MNYDDIDVDEALESVVSAVEQGNYRKATEKESTEVRLAALSAINQEVQAAVKAGY